MSEQTTEQQESVAHLGDVISAGEGDYDSYNTGTKYGKLQSGRVDLSKMTVDQILEASNRRDRSRIFAAGKYQIITSTLQQAKTQLKLSGSELFTHEFQERLFLEFFLGKKHAEVGAYITKGVGTSEDAVYGTAKEWMSIEVPAGRKTWKGGISNGHHSFREGDGVNRARKGSGAKVQAALEGARESYAKAKEGDTTPVVPVPLGEVVGDQRPTEPTPETQTTPQTQATPDGTGGTVTVTVSELTPVAPGHLIAGSVGRGGRNHEGDVGAIQQALASHGHSPGKIDHKIGPLTIGAIRAFQRGFLRRPDGLVEVGRATEQRLMAPGSQTTTTTTTSPEDKTSETDEAVRETAPTTVETPTTETTPNTPTTTDTPTTTKVTTSNATLGELMAKPHLSVDEIREARAMIAKEPVAARGDLYEALQAKSVYLSQRDNQSMGMRAGKYQNLGDWMCNLTALAMCLEYLGVPNPHPDLAYPDALEKVRLQKRLPARTTEGGWGGVASALGVGHVALGGGRRARAWWQSTLLGALRSGKAVMCSIEDHIVRLQDVTDEGVVADDPFGHSKLLASKSHRTRSGSMTSHTWRETNHKPGKNDGKRDNAGEDITWPWAEVESHNFLWIAAFSTR